MGRVHTLTSAAGSGAHDAHYSQSFCNSSRQPYQSAHRDPNTNICIPAPTPAFPYMQKCLLGYCCVVVVPHQSTVLFGPTRCQNKQTERNQLLTQGAIWLIRFTGVLALSVPCLWLASMVKAGVSFFLSHTHSFLQEM